MSHSHKEHAHKDHPRYDAKGEPQGMRKHAKWIVTIGAVLMIGAMIIYVLTLDESVRPGNPASSRPPRRRDHFDGIQPARLYTACGRQGGRDCPCSSW